MLFKFFKRGPPEPPKPKKRRPAAPVIPRAELPTEPSALPEVTEGSDHTDWALWEDSVAALDSQMQSIQPGVKIYGQANEPPSEYQELEAYATVKKKDP